MDRCTQFIELGKSSMAGNKWENMHRVRPFTNSTFHPPTATYLVYPHNPYSSFHSSLLIIRHLFPRHHFHELLLFPITVIHPSLIQTSSHSSNIPPYVFDCNSLSHWIHSKGHVAMRSNGQDSKTNDWGGLNDMCTWLKDQRKMSAYTSERRDRGSTRKTQQNLHVVVLFRYILFLVKYWDKSNGFQLW
jgi:hypothetical protein